MKTGRAFALAFALGTLGAWSALAPGALADISFCPPGSGAGQCSTPRGVATDFTTDRLYVADEGNNRVDVFKASTAEFLFAFGWGVDTGTAKPETCTTASTCQAGIAGAGPGQLSSPAWIAVDNAAASSSLHSIYVTEQGNHRVQKFDPAGAFLLTFGKGVNTGTSGKADVCTNAGPPTDVCGAGSAGTGVGQFAAIKGIAVVSPGTVYVNDTESEGSCPEESASSKVLKRIQKFNPTGELSEEVKPTDAPCGQVSSFTADSAGNYYLSSQGFGAALRKYAPSATTASCTENALPETNGLGVDATDNLYASQRESAVNPPSHRVITKFDPGCSVLRRFGYGKIGSSLAGVAAFPSAGGDVFGSEGAKTLHYLNEPPPGPLVARIQVVSTGNAQATVRAEINPEGKATSYHFEYLTEKEFEEQGNSFTGPKTKSTETKALSLANGAFRVNVTEDTLLGCPVASKQLIEEGKCLTPETKYRWRVVPSNADGEGEGPKEGVAFETREPFEIQEVFTTDVATDAATLNARLNPFGIAAKGYFEYVDDATFQLSGFEEAIKVPNPDAEPPQAELDFGEGSVPVKRSVTLPALQEGTTYHYRLSATDALIEGVRFSEEATFTTFRKPVAEICPENEAFRGGASSLLPDCRAYELVSPLDKANGDIVVQQQILTLLPAVLEQAATSGERLTYGSYRAFADPNAAPYTSQYMSSRDPATGWGTHPISPPEGKLIANGAELDFEFRIFSDDLCEGWIVPLAGPILAPDAIPGHYNLYRRTDQLCGGESYEALSTGRPENLPEGVDYRIEPQGVAADGETTVFAANDSLEGSGAPAQPGGRLQLYIKGPGEGPPRYVCILPGGAPSTSACSAGSGEATRFPYMRSANVTNALSDDGLRVYWTASGNDGPIYLRENPLGEGGECSGLGAPCTIAVSAAGEALSKTSASHFWAAAADGSAAIYETGGDLYEFDLATKATNKIAGKVSGVAGASEDARRVYFISGEALTGEEENSEKDKAQPGKANLYLHEAGPGTGTYSFVATLAARDARAILSRDESSTVGREPQSHNSRVSASGLQVAFMASAPITGYDLSDASSPERCGEAKGICDNEVFLYDAGANGGAGELLCVSCNPSGSRPAGANFGNENFPFWVAGRLPVFQTTLYPSRLFSADGSRLFFEAQDSLVPRDSNGHLDVYQWERSGTGGCDASDPTFSVEVGGCVDLISSGQSARDSTIVDASSSGDDVFFTTLSGLLPEDYGLVDIYDARVGGGFPSPPPPAPECEGESCQNPPPAPEFQTPATESNAGPANPKELAARRKPCRRTEVRRRSRCVKRKGNARHRAQRRHTPKHH